MECFIEASPRSMNFWVKGAGELILSGSKYTLSDVRDSIFAGRMALTIHSFQKSDVGTYRCVAKNSLGEVEGRIQVYGKPTLITDAPPRTSLGLSSQIAKDGADSLILAIQNESTTKQSGACRFKWTPTNNSRASHCCHVGP